MLTCGIRRKYVEVMEIYGDITLVYCFGPFLGSPTTIIFNYYQGGQGQRPVTILRYLPSVSEFDLCRFEFKSVVTTVLA